jgi:uncharacterized protein YbaP (TraB family)
MCHARRVTRHVLFLVLVGLFACRDEAPKRTATRDVVGSGSASGSAGPTVITPDPWAAPAKSEVVADDACPSVTAPYFFRVEKDGKTSHLLGTRHIGVAWRKMPKAVHQALRDAKLVVFETVDDDGSDDTPAPTKGAKRELGDKLWKRYRDLAGDALADSMEDASPAQAMIMLMVRYEDRLSSLEREIGAEAEELKKPIRGLETSAFQQKLLDRYLNGRAARAFVEQLDNLDELRQDTIDDLREYCGGTDETPGVEPDERAEMMASGYTAAEIDQMDQELLFDRNHNWIPDLEKIFAEGDAFVAVGADHTRGDQGVPALLTARGYQVTRITPPVASK